MHKTSIRQKFFLLIFSLFLAVIILELGLRLGGFVLLSLQEYRNRISLREKGTYRILCLGESTTEAGGVDSYPSQLQEILNERKIGEKFSVINKGLSGITTEGIVSQLKGNLDKYNPDMVIVMMGINDGPETRKHDEEKEKRPVFSFTSFRVYKLARLLRLHFIQKLKELGYAGISEGNFANQKNNYSLPAIREINKKESNMPAGGNADDFWAKINSGKRYREVQGEYNKAIEKFKEAIEIDPDNDIGYSELGNCYILTGELDKCEEALKKALEKSPEKGEIYNLLGFCNLNQKKYNQAEEAFRKAIERKPKDVRAYYDLGRCYLLTGEIDKATEMFEKVIEMNPQNDRAYGAVAFAYKELGRENLALHFFEEANRARLEYINPVTKYHYKMLHKIIAQRGIKLACVQYPVRNVQSLKKTLDYSNDIIFVDNEKIFKDALKSAAYDDYFSDTFGGDFGHCTKKGNLLLAGNIADTIISKYFKKKWFIK